MGDETGNGCSWALNARQRSQWVGNRSVGKPPVEISLPPTPREEAAAPANSGVLTRSSLGGDEEREVDYKGCEGGSTVIVK